MSNIVEFPRRGVNPSTNVTIEAPTYFLTIDEEIYEVYSIVRPRLKHVEWEVFTLQGEKTVQGPAYWEPMIVEGQVHGGLAQGIGQALLEESIYDRESGQLITGSFMDYTMPRADDLPEYQVDMTVTKCPSNPLGIKGCGEAGAIGSPPAVINAVAHAIGNDDIVMPATPQRVWRSLQESA